MKELNKGTILSVLIHGAMLGLFLWLTWDSEPPPIPEGGSDGAAGEVSLASNTSANRPIDVSDLQVPPQPTPPPEEVKPDMPPVIPDEPKPVEPEQPTPMVKDDLPVKDTPDAVPIIEKKEPIKVKPVVKKETPTPPNPVQNKKPIAKPVQATAVSRPLTTAERIAAIRAAGLDKSHVKKNNGRLIALNNAITGSKSLSTDATAIGNGLSKGVRNELLGTISVGGGGKGGTGPGGSGGGDSTGDGSPDGDRYIGALMGYLKRVWQQPSRAEVGGGNPTAVVSLTIQSDGTVTVARLSRGSQAQAMDASLNALIRGLKRVPAPAEFGKKSSSVSVAVKFKLD